MDLWENTVILLAAGYGKRIRTLTDDPKCLLRIGDKSLLERHLEIWKTLGVKKVHIVLGYKGNRIKEVADSYAADFDLSYSLNDDYEKQGNTFSLYLGIRKLSGPCLIFDADIIYEAHLLKDFFQNRHENQMLVGKGRLSDIESTKVLVDGRERIRILADKRAVGERELERHRFVGEAVGVLKFSREYTRRLSIMAEEFLSKEENLPLNWEHLINKFIRENDVGAHSFERGKWIEIDTREDFERARGMFEEQHEGNI